MSSEFDMSFEDFLNYDFDPEVLSSGFYSHDTEGQQKSIDSQMLDFPAGDLDNFDGEALGQSSALSHPDQPPWTADAASDQLLELQETASNSGLPPGWWWEIVNPSLAHTHMNKILNQWSGATKCPWLKCSSRATFKTRSSLRTHICNIHVNPLTCTNPQCSYKRPFGKQHELHRHILTAHETIRNHKCPVATCEASITGFARKDKLKKHLREEHEHLKCLYNHCSAIVLDTEQELHITESHGDYECAVGGCEKGDASCFSIENLRRHLRSAHYMSYDPVERLSWIAMKLDGVVKTDHLRNRKELPSCATCSLSQSTEYFTPNS